MLKSLAGAVYKPSKDESQNNRLSLQCLHFTPDYVEATDGHILLRKPIKKNKSSGEYLINAVKNKIDFTFGDIKEVRKESIVLNNGREIPKEGEKYPDSDSVIPNIAKPTITIGIDLKVLKRLIDATGTTNSKSKESSLFKFEFDTATTAIKITQVELRNEIKKPIYGLIMPVRLPLKKENNK